MSTPREIVATFNRLEAEAGGYAKSDAAEVLRRTADELGISYEEAREAMLDEWIGGAG